MTPIRGRYPGGPSRGPEPGPSRPRPAGVEEIEGKRAARAEKAIRRRRRRRIRGGLGLILAIALATGGWLGIQAHTTAEEEALRLEAVERDRMETELRSETDRVLRELWRMEEMERAPRR